jgi:putative transcriptional regulator
MMQLINHFLIAMPGLTDFNFSRAVVYICAHNEEGSMGLVVNHPIINVKLGEVLGQMSIPVTNSAINDWLVYLGGPVQPERGFIIHQPNTSWQSTLVTSDQLGVTSSQDILQALAQGGSETEEPISTKALVLLGYAGWEAGQLEKEIANNLWLTAPADTRVLFETPCELRWRAAVATLGIDASTLSGDAGHA